jgi:hypothetical protein
MIQVYSKEVIVTLVVDRPFLLWTVSAQGLKRAPDWVVVDRLHTRPEACAGLEDNVFKLLQWERHECPAAKGLNALYDTYDLRDFLSEMLSQLCKSSR